jgi:hypothetical protein
MLVFWVVTRFAVDKQSYERFGEHPTRVFRAPAEDSMVLRIVGGVTTQRTNTSDLQSGGRSLMLDAVRPGELRKQCKSIRIPGGLTGYRTKYMLKAVPRFRSLVAALSPRRPGFTPGSIDVGFVVDKVPLGQVFPCQYHSTVALQTHIIWGMCNMLT